jgi:hypothetical protein
MAPRQLSQRELNRATLARQLLLERSELAPLDALEHLVGLQAQTTQSWYTGLWSRLRDFDPFAFGALLESREIVRTNVMRSTLHLLTARDALTITPLVSSVVERMSRGSFTRFWKGLDLDAVRAEGRRILDEASERPAGGLTSAELGTALQARWPDRDRLALAVAVRSVTPLAHVPPRGVWGKAGQARMAPLERWLGRALDPHPSIDALVLRYLAAFGPASVMDVQAWCGLTRLSEVVDRLRGRLETFTDVAGRELFDLPDAPRPPADTPAPPRFLYDYDNLLLSHADRSRVNEDDFFQHGWTADGAQPSCLLIDGRVGGTWLQSGSVLEIRLFARIPSTDRHELEAEGMRLLGFLTRKRASTEVDARSLEVVVTLDDDRG